MSDYRDQVFPGQGGASRSRRIVLEFESFRDFIQAFSPQVSEEGMFVSSEFLPDGLPESGEEVAFEVRLSDDFRLVQGQGEVAWVRESDVEHEATGAAIRFIDLDEPSRRLVSRLVSNFEKDGGKPFALAGPAAVGLDTVEPEVLDRVEADELFASDLPGSISEREELDSVAPAEDFVEEAELSESEFGLTTEGLEEGSSPGLEVPASESLGGELPGPEPSSEEAPDAEAPGAEELGEQHHFDVPDLDLESTLPVDQPGDYDKVGLDAAGGVAVDQAADLSLPFDLDETSDGLDEDLTDVLAAEDSSGPPVPVISDDIAQIAEELSGVHKVDSVEMPTEDQLTFAGAAQAKEGRRGWRTLLFASLAGIALGVAAWFFAGDQLKSWIGLGGGESAIVAEDGDEPMAPASSPAISEDRIVEPGDSPEAPVESSDLEPSIEGRETAELSTVESTSQSQPVEQAVPPATGDSIARVERPAAQAAGVSRIEEISWDERDGETVLAIRLDGAVSDESYEVVRIREGAPREVIKIFGVSSPYSPSQLEVGSAQVVRLRTGLHGAEGSRQIHIVADLTGAAAAVTLVRTSGNTLLVTFS